MNNAKMWLVVPPAVGVPIFLGAVAVGSFSVHVAVLTNTSWVDDFLKGVPMGTGDQTASAPMLQSDDPAKASYVTPRADGSREITVIMPDGTTAKAIIPPESYETAMAPPRTSSQ